MVNLLGYHGELLIDLFNFGLYGSDLSSFICFDFVKNLHIFDYSTWSSLHCYNLFISVVLIFTALSLGTLFRMYAVHL